MDISTDIIKINTDIVLIDKEENVITVQTPLPEKIELWV